MIRNYLLTAYAVYTRRKLFTAINLLCICLTLVILLVVAALLHNSLYPGGLRGKGDRYLEVVSMQWVDGDGQGRRGGPLGYKVIDQYLRRQTSAAMVAGVTGPRAVSVYQADRMSELWLRRADAEYWQIVDFELLAGRVPSVDDVRRGRFVLTISESAARRLFGEPRQALGSDLDIDGQRFQVIGVVADSAQLDAVSDLWAPVTTYPSSEYREQMWGEFSALLLAADAADLPVIQAEVQQLAGRLEFDDPARWKTAYLWADSKLDSLARGLFGNTDQAQSGAGLLLVALAIGGLLFMLLPALNLVNLNTGRILERSSEIGVRKAFGATSNQLVLQLIVENVLLSLLGGGLALLLAKLALLWLHGSGLVPYLQVQLNLPLFAIGLLISVVFGVLSGVVPAWKTSRLDPVDALKGAI